jgi:hypothetical protein
MRGRWLVGGGAWTPASLPSPALWLTASASYCFSDAGLTAPCGVGDGVYWKGRAGGNNATQATASKRPTFQAGPSVRFDGTDDFLSLASAVTISGGCSVYFVQTTTGDCALAGYSGTNAPQVRVGQGGANVLSVYDGTNNPQSAALSVARGTRTVSGFVLSGTTVTFYENGTARGTGTWNPTNVLDQLGTFSIGANFLTGDLHEVVVTTAALSASDRLLLDSYFRAKWGTP